MLKVRIKLVTNKIAFSYIQNQFYNYPSPNIGYLYFLIILQPIPHLICCSTYLLAALSFLYLVMLLAL